MRLKAEIWVKAYIRRCASNGVPAIVARRGQSDGGVIFIKVNSLNGSVELYGPAPAGLDESSLDRCWVGCLGNMSVPEADADGYLQRQLEFDPDIWIIEVEDRDGRHFLGEALSDA